MVVDVSPASLLAVLAQGDDPLEPPLPAAVLAV